MNSAHYKLITKLNVTAAKTNMSLFNFISFLFFAFYTNTIFLGKLFFNIKFIFGSVLILFFIFFLFN